MRFGNVRQRDGVWMVRDYWGTDPITGRPIRPQKSFPEARTREEAEKAAEEWRARTAPFRELRSGEGFVPLLYRYIASLRAENAAKLTTVDTYASLVRCYVAPYLGAKKVGEMNQRHIHELYDVLAVRGGRDGRGISPATLRKLHNFLRGAVRWMVDGGVLESNFMDSIDAPRADRREAASFGVDDFERLSAALERALRLPAADRSGRMRRSCAMAAYISLWSGARCGEVCGLSVDDFRRSVRGGWELHIGHTVAETSEGLIRTAPKSASGRRSVALSDRAADEVRRHLEWRASFAPADSRERPLVCAKPGVWMRPSTVSRQFSRMRDAIGLPRGTSFHTLRHTHASWLLANGISVREVSQRLGHSKPTMTLETYAHVLPGSDRAAAEAFERAAGRTGL